MVVISAKDLLKEYGVEIILDKISFSANKGDRIGIVGANGAGKSTLLNILSENLDYDSGELYIASGVKIGYLKQMNNFESDKTVMEEMEGIFAEVIEIEEEMTEISNKISEQDGENEEALMELIERYDYLTEEFRDKNGYGYKSEIYGILNSMAFYEDFYNKKTSELSGGERTRLALAALLLKKPDLLFLDEPTNHLDIGTLKWLEQYLKSYTGTIFIISHDRYFLDQTVNKVFEIENHRLNIYNGNYTEYAEKRRFKREEEEKQYEHQQKEIKRQEEIIRRFKQRGTEKLAKRAQSREKQMETIEVFEKPSKEKGAMHLRFKQNFQSGSDVLFAEHLEKGFGSGAGKRNLFENVDLDIKRGERICMVGANGVGKTTLLKIIMEAIEPDKGYVKKGYNVTFGYYDQEQKVISGRGSVLEEIHSAYRLYKETELRSLLGSFLFQGDMVFQDVSSLSGGEKARLALLKIMLSGSNFLIMDEPTNHLDIQSKEAFENSLLNFPGTVFIVSHDRYFLNKIPNRILELTKDGIVNYVGDYEYYIEKKEKVESGKNYLEELSKNNISTGTIKDLKNKEALLQSEKERSREKRKADKEEQAKKRRQEREIILTEEKISEVEEKILELEQELCKEDVFSDHLKSAEISKELESLKAILEEAYKKWEELQ